MIQNTIYSSSHIFVSPVAFFKYANCEPTAGCSSSESKDTLHLALVHGDHGITSFDWIDKDKLLLDVGNYTKAFRLSTARSIATQCFKDGGMGVLKARALCLSLLKEYYEDPQGCTNLQEATNRNAASASPNIAMVAMPNPARDELDVHWSVPLETDGRLDVLDLDGKVVLSNTIGKGASSKKLFLQHLPGGIYYLRLQSDGTQSAALKVVVIH